MLKTWVRNRVLLQGLIAIWFAASLHAATFTANGTSLTVTTTNVQVTFNGPDVTGIVNKLTGETYLRNPTSNMLSNLTLIQPPSQGLAATGAWSVGSSSASLTLSDSNRNYSMTVSVDPTSQELVINLNGTANQGGVQWLIWGITGFDVSLGKFVIPAQGGISLNTASFTAQSTYNFFGMGWDAPLSLFQTGAGGVAIYSRDTQSRVKDLTLTSNQVQTVNELFYLEAPGPWSSATQAGPIEWRISAYQGDWQAGARVYRDWHLSVAPPTPLSGNRAWAANITTVVEEDGGHPYNTSDLDSLATVLVPSKTLLYLVNWRSNTYDVGYPDYSWDSTLPAFITHAHSLGFRVMLHTDVLGVAATSSDYASVQQYQIRDPQSLQLQGWNWNLSPSYPQRYALIDPAASAYRSLFIARVTPAIQTLQPDAIHLDFTTIFNDGNGLIEGRNFNQGLSQLESDLLTAFPNLVLGLEEINDAIAAQASFGQPLYWSSMGFDPAVTPPVPIAEYVMPNVRCYWHLGVSNPDQSGFLANLEQYEAQAVLPTIHTTVSSYTQTDVARFLNVIGAFQSYDLQPAWDTPWNGAIVKYQGANGTTATLTDSATLLQFSTQSSSSSSIVYQRVHGVNSLNSTSSVDNWPAYNGALTIGLDPAVQYWLDSTAPSTALPHITSMPAGVRVGLGTGTLVTPNFAYFQLLPPASPAFDFFEGLWLANIGVTYQGTDYPLQSGAVVNLTQMTVGGVTRQAIFTHPPFTAQRGGDTFLEYTVPMPSSGGASVSFAAGILDSAIGQRQGPLTFRVAVNGTVLWQQDVSTGGWQAGTVDLSSYLGQTVKIRFITDPGPSGDPDFGWGGWSALHLTIPSTDSISGISLAVPSGLMPANFALTGGSLSVSNGAAIVNNLPSGGTILVFTGQPTTIASGQNLLTNASYTLSQSSNGQLAGPGTSLYLGTGAIGSTTAGGITKPSTLYAFAPGNGQAIFSWLLRLPATPSLSFSFSAGYWDGHEPLPQGYLMSVRINGTVLWQHNLGSGSGWQYGNIALAQWSGQTVLLELITDSLGPNTNNFTSWAELAFSGGTSNCATSLSSYSLISAPLAGSNGSLTVTTASGCDWIATSNSEWITATPSNSSGSGSVSYTVAANLGAPRQSTLVVGGYEITVSQAGYVPVTVNTSPTGLSFTVDSNTYNSAQTFTWVSGSTHPVSVTSPQGSNTRYVFANWSDAQAQSHNIAVPTLPGTYTANFTTQYLLTTSVSPAGAGGINANPSSPDGYYNSGVSVQLTASAGAGYGFLSFIGDLTGNTNPQNIVMLAPHSVTAVFGSPLRFVPVTPCRVADTRKTAPPAISGGSTRNFTIPGVPCGIPNTAQAYSLNIAVVPPGPLGFLTAWAAGQPQPAVSILNSVDGRIKSNAAIVPAGTGGAISVFASNTTDVILDINGYFIPATDPGGLAFFPLTPCRVVDTRKPAAPLAGPSLVGQQSRRFPIPSSDCNIPATAQAYSLNFAAVPPGPLGFITAYPTGQSQPVVASLNDATGTTLANAVIVPAGTNGAIDIFASNNTNLVIDIDGYFAPMAAGGLSLYNATPCRELDTRKPVGSPPFTGARDVTISGNCGIPTTAEAFVLSATVAPTGPLGYLTLWPQGQTQPKVATLNAVDGAITSNMAIVPTNNGSISAFVSNSSHLILDIFAFFAQ